MKARVTELTFLALCLALIAATTLPGCKRRVSPAPTPSPDAVVVDRFSVDTAFARYRKAWALVALETARYCEQNKVGEVEGNAFAKPRQEAALRESFGILADELDAQMKHNPATAEEYAAAMREMAYLADSSLREQK